MMVASTLFNFYHFCLKSQSFLLLPFFRQKAVNWQDNSLLGSSSQGRAWYKAMTHFAQALVSHSLTFALRTVLQERKTPSMNNQNDFCLS
jgi:hypothetical protein